MQKIILQPFSEQRLGDILKESLQGHDMAWDSFQAAVAFAKRSGVQHLQKELQEFVEQGGYVRIVVGIDQYGTSFEGLADLLEVVGQRGEIWINHDEDSYVTFHPKLYLFERNNEALLIVGSGNFTQGGLYTNDEALLVNLLDATIPHDKIILDEVKAALDEWCNNELKTANRLDPSFLQALVDANYVKSEAEIKVVDRQTKTSTGASSVAKTILFGRGLSRRRPSPPKRRKDTTLKEPMDEVPLSTNVNEQIRGFVMTLQHTDVGTGQTTPGTSRRSPEVFIPLTARNLHPEFWGWPDKFTADATKLGKFDRVGVLMRIGGKITSVNMMTWPDKHDFRLRNEALRSAGQVGDILRIEKVEETQEFAYYIEIIPLGTTTYQYYLNLCTNQTRNSVRMWGYY